MDTCMHACIHTETHTHIHIRRRMYQQMESSQLVGKSPCSLPMDGRQHAKRTKPGEHKQRC